MNSSNDGGEGGGRGEGGKRGEGREGGDVERLAKRE